VSAQVQGDTALEEDENFLVALSGATNGAVITGARSSAAGVIRNDEAAPPPASFQGLGHPEGYSDSWAGAVTPNGNIVIGVAQWCIPQFACGIAPFRWTAATGTQLAITSGDDRLGLARAVSADGNVIVGEAFMAAMRIVNGTRFVLDHPAGMDTSYFMDVSGDGSTAVGTAYVAPGFTTTPYRWANGSWSPLAFPAGHNTGGARAISDNGNVIAGITYDDSASKPKLTMWTDGVPNNLGTPFEPNGEIGTSHLAMSADGTVISVRVANGAYRWNGGTWTQIVNEPQLAEPQYDDTRPQALNSNGTVLVGQMSRVNLGPPSLPSEAFRWTAAEGAQKISALLAAEGISTTGWQLTEATGVSADGTVIVGYGTNPSGRTEAWIARLPLPTAEAVRQRRAAAVR
jgi:uncharacterized membrane protein